MNAVVGVSSHMQYLAPFRTLTELIPGPYFSIIKVHLIDINVFEKI